MVVVVGALYFGQDILMPVALAVLLSFALAPVVVRLRRWGLGRVPSVILVVLLMFMVMLGFGTLVASQLVDLAQNLPNYEQNIRAKIQSVRGATEGGGGGVLDQATQMLKDLSKELDQATAPAAPGAVQRAGEEGRVDVLRPIPVEVHEPRPSPWNEIQTYLGPLVGPIGTAGMVLVFVIFMLLEREGLRDRLIRLVGANDLHRTTEAMDEAGARVSRYLLMQLIINIAYGIPVALGLWLIGVPNPILWGVLATVLRFIPYVGPVISSLFPIILSFAVSPGWTDPLLTIGLFMVLELFSNNVLEPWLYGSSTGLSPVAIIAAAVFWITLWGPVGVLLATPLTVCMVVIGRHVPQLQFLHVMFGNDPVLPTETGSISACSPATRRKRRNWPNRRFPTNRCRTSTTTWCFPPCILRKPTASGTPWRTRSRPPSPRGSTASSRRSTTTRTRSPKTPRRTPNTIRTARQPPQRRPPGVTVAEQPQGRVLSVAGRNELDRAPAALLAHLLERQGVKAETLPCQAISLRNLSKLDTSDVRLVCVSYLNPGSVQHARRIVRRLRGKLDRRIPIVVGLWSTAEDGPLPADAPALIGADRLETTLSGAAAWIGGQDRQNANIPE